jgi:hypothetical protein
MMYAWEEQEFVDEFLDAVLPPNIKVMPEDPGDMRNISYPCLFDGALITAIRLRNWDNKPLLFEALRKKWPKAVEEQLPEAQRQAEIRHNKYLEAIGEQIPKSSSRVKTKVERIRQLRALEPVPA